jgi:DNA gyrase subunit B
MDKKVETLDWQEAVRKRPAMYIGSTGFTGITFLMHTLIKNIFYKTECNHFEIEIEGKLSGKLVFHNVNHSIIHSINEDLRLDSYDFSLLNALSNKYHFTLYDENKNVLFTLDYEKGELKKGVSDKSETFANTLEVNFTLDDSIWDFEKLRVLNITDQIKDLAFLCNDKKFEIKYKEREESSRIIYKFENGLLDKFEYESSNAWGDLLFVNHSNHTVNDISLELAFGLSTFYSIKTQISSYVNFSETKDHGTHVIALIKGIKKALKKYQKLYLPEKNILIRSSSIKKSLLGSIHIQIENPTYWGPTRARLQNHEIIKPISKYVSQTFLQELEKNKDKTEEFLDRLSYV